MQSFVRWLVTFLCILCVAHSYLAGWLQSGPQNQNPEASGSCELGITYIIYCSAFTTLCLVGKLFLRPHRPPHTPSLSFIEPGPSNNCLCFVHILLSVYFIDPFCPLSYTSSITLLITTPCFSVVSISSLFSVVISVQLFGRLGWQQD